MKPLITIGIPTHNPNRIPYLREAIASARQQTYAELDILVHQDPANSDQTSEIQDMCFTLAKEDSRIRFLKNDRQRGLAGNWNALADAARGEWMMFLGDDDRLLPVCMETLLANRLEKAEVVFSNHYLMDAKGQRLMDASRALTEQYRRDQAPPGPVVDPEEWCWRNAIPIPSALLRTAMVRRLRFKEDLNNPEIELYLRLAKEGGRFIFVRDFLMEYRVHPNSETARGLYSANFVAHLAAIPARPGLEPLKQTFLAAELERAVGRRLAKADLLKARELIQHPYYGRTGWRNRIQRLCGALPGSSGVALYRALRGLNHISRVGRK